MTVTATDSTANASAYVTFTWTVSTSTVSLTSPGSQSNHDGATVTVPLTSSDSASNAMSFAATGLPSGLTINSSTGAISGLIAPTDDTNSPYNVTVTATDATANASAYVTFTWTVSTSTVSLTSPGNQSNHDGATVTLPLTSSDSASNALSFAATGLPSGLTINSSTGAISGLMRPAPTPTARTA